MEGIIFLMRTTLKKNEQHKNLYFKNRVSIFSIFFSTETENLKRVLIQIQDFHYIYLHTYDGKTASISLEL